MEQDVQILLIICRCTGWSRRNAWFSYKNNFVYFQHKKVLITQKRRYFNAFLKYVPNYVRKMSVRWRPSYRTNIRSLSSKSCISRPNNFLRHSCDFLTKDPAVLNASTHRSTVFRYGIAHRRSTLNFRRKRRWTVTTESVFLKNCSTANTRCSAFQCAIATETALSELSTGSCPTSSTPPLPSTSH